MPVSLTEFDEDTTFERYVLDRGTPLLPRPQGTSIHRTGRLQLDERFHRGPVGDGPRWAD
jgi:hypothetical protein